MTPTLLKSHTSGQNCLTWTPNVLSTPNPFFPFQTQESLNPNNLEYWMEDIHTPGYDSLLKRKEAEFRRAKVCKIGALIAAAACTVILVIVVPICTMKSWSAPSRALRSAQSRTLSLCPCLFWLIVKGLNTCEQYGISPITGAALWLAMWTFEEWGTCIV